jgi:hypothetical protein
VPPESSPEGPTDPVLPSDEELQGLADRLDAAATGVKDTYGLVARIDLTDEERQGPMGALVMAFQYGQARDSKPGEAYFTKLLGYEDGSRYPPELAAVPAEVADLWDRASALVSVPLTKSRLRDLCFEGRWGRVGDHARLAGEAYLDLASELARGETSEQLRAVRALRQCEALRRARVLARLSGQADLGKRAAGAIVDALRDVLATDPLDLGRAIVLLETAIEEELPGEEIEDLLALLRAEKRDIFFTERVIRFQLERAPDNETRTKLHRELVEAWMQEAEQSNPAHRTWNLTTAAARARDFGINDLLAQLTSELQQTKLEDHGLVEHRVSVPIDGAEAEAYVQGFLDQASWREALLLLIANDPPTGKLERNRANAEEMVRIAPLTATLQATLLGADGLPRFTAATDEEQAELRLIRCELAQLQVLGSFVTKILHRIGVKWGPIPVEDLAAFLGEAAHVAPPVSATLARAFNRYFQDDFEAAGYTATPQIERLVRDIVLAVNEPAYRLQRGKTPGQYAGLGALLPVLQRAGVTESWLRFLQTVFAATAGMNFRNDLLHGFVDEIHAGHAALALLAALYLTRGVILEAAPADPPAPEASIP